MRDGAAAAGAHEVGLDVPMPATGVYVVRLGAGGQAQVRRLVVAR